jgi:hypothetical protein
MESTTPVEDRPVDSDTESDEASYHDDSEDYESDYEPDDEDVDMGNENTVLSFDSFINNPFIEGVVLSVAKSEEEEKQTDSVDYRANKLIGILAYGLCVCVEAAVPNPKAVSDTNFDVLADYILRESADKINENTVARAAAIVGRGILDVTKDHGLYDSHNDPMKRLIFRMAVLYGATLHENAPHFDIDDPSGGDGHWYTYTGRDGKNVEDFEATSEVEDDEGILSRAFRRFYVRITDAMKNSVLDNNSKTLDVYEGYRDMRDVDIYNMIMALGKQKIRVDENDLKHILDNNTGDYEDSVIHVHTLDGYSRRNGTRAVYRRREFGNMAIDPEDGTIYKIPKSAVSDETSARACISSLEGDDYTNDFSVIRAPVTADYDIRKDMINMHTDVMLMFAPIRSVLHQKLKYHQPLAINEGTTVLRDARSYRRCALKFKVDPVLLRRVADLLISRDRLSKHSDVKIFTDYKSKTPFDSDEVGMYMYRVRNKIYKNGEPAPMFFTKKSIAEYESEEINGMKDRIKELRKENNEMTKDGKTLSPSEKIIHTSNQKEIDVLENETLRIKQMIGATKQSFVKVARESYFKASSDPDSTSHFSSAMDVSFSNKDLLYKTNGASLVSVTEATAGRLDIDPLVVFNMQDDVTDIEQMASQKNLTERGRALCLLKYARCLLSIQQIIPGLRSVMYDEIFLPTDKNISSMSYAWDTINEIEANILNPESKMYKNRDKKEIEGYIDHYMLMKKLGVMNPILFMLKVAQIGVEDLLSDSIPSMIFNGLTNNQKDNVLRHLSDLMFCAEYEGVDGIVVTNRKPDIILSDLVKWIIATCSNHATRQVTRLAKTYFSHVYNLYFKETEPPKIRYDSKKYRSMSEQLFSDVLIAKRDIAKPRSENGEVSGGGWNSYVIYPLNPKLATTKQDGMFVDLTKNSHSNLTALQSVRTMHDNLSRVLSGYVSLLDNDDEVEDGDVVMGDTVSEEITDPSVVELLKKYEREVDVMVDVEVSANGTYKTEKQSVLDMLLSDREGPVIVKSVMDRHGAMMVEMILESDSSSEYSKLDDGVSPYIRDSEEEEDDSELQVIQVADRFRKIVRRVAVSVIDLLNTKSTHSRLIKNKTHALKAIRDYLTDMELGPRTIRRYLIREGEEKDKGPTIEVSIKWIRMTYYLIVDSLLLTCDAMQTLSDSVTSISNSSLLKASVPSIVSQINDNSDEVMNLVEELITHCSKQLGVEDIMSADIGDDVRSGDSIIDIPKDYLITATGTGYVAVSTAKTAVMRSVLNGFTSRVDLSPLPKSDLKTILVQDKSEATKTWMVQAKMLRNMARLSYGIQYADMNATEKVMDLRVRKPVDNVIKPIIDDEPDDDEEDEEEVSELEKSQNESSVDIDEQSTAKYLTDKDRILAHIAILKGKRSELLDLLQKKIQQDIISKMHDKRKSVNNVEMMAHLMQAITLCGMTEAYQRSLHATYQNYMGDKADIFKNIIISFSRPVEVGFNRNERKKRILKKGYEEIFDRRMSITGRPSFRHIKPFLKKDVVQWLEEYYPIVPKSVSMIKYCLPFEYIKQ